MLTMMSQKAVIGENLDLRKERARGNTAPSSLWLDIVMDA